MQSVVVEDGPWIPLIGVALDPSTSRQLTI